jgi:hypothetical protein
MAEAAFLLLQQIEQEQNPAEQAVVGPAEDATKYKPI